MFESEGYVGSARGVKFYAVSMRAFAEYARKLPTDEVGYLYIGSQSSGKFGYLEHIRVPHK